MGEDRSGASAIDELLQHSTKKRGDGSVHFTLRLYEEDVAVLVAIRKECVCSKTEAIRIALMSYKKHEMEGK